MVRARTHSCTLYGSCASYSHCVLQAFLSTSMCHGTKRWSLGRFRLLGLMWVASRPLAAAALHQLDHCVVLIRFLLGPGANHRGACRVAFL